MRNDCGPASRHRAWLGLYRGLLRLMPRALRERHGLAMLDLFERDLTRADRGSVLAPTGTAIAGLCDLVGRALLERGREERRGFDDAARVLLRQTATGFAAAVTALTTMLVLLSIWRLRELRASGDVLEVALYSIPYTAALTIPMATFVAVLVAAASAIRTRRTASPHAGTPVRLLPLVGVASIIAAATFGVTAEAAPRANQRLEAILAGRSSAALSDRSMTLRQLRSESARLRSEPGIGAADHGAADHAASDLAAAQQARLAVEIHKRFALPAACIVLTLLAVGVAYRADRQGDPRWGIPGTVVFTGYVSVVSVSVFTGHLLLLSGGESLADRAALSPGLAMWSANAATVTLAIIIAAMRSGRGGRDASAGRSVG